MGLTPRRCYWRPFQPPSLAKHIKALLKQLCGEPKLGSISKDGGSELLEALDKNFGYRKNFRAKYRLVQKLGIGYSGHVFSARGKKGELKDQPVAVKIISKSRLKFATHIEDLQLEVKILKSVSGHKHLLRFYDAFEDDKNVYIVMELCEGGDLSDRIYERGGSFTEEETKFIVKQMLSVVSFCHLQGIVHCDLKPENIMFTSGGDDAEVKLIDFGVSGIIKLDTGSGICELVKRSDPKFDDEPWPSVSPEAKDFVKRLLCKNEYKRMTAAEALGHPWLSDESQPVPLDFLIYKFVGIYLTSTPLRCAAQKALSKVLTEDELVYLRAQFRLLEPNQDGSVSLENFEMAVARYATDIMDDESWAPKILSMMGSLADRKMYFEEFCSAAIHIIHLEADEGWEQTVSTAFEHFEQEGNCVISYEEFCKELYISGPEALSSVSKIVSETLMASSI
ncbi:hypothetical protein CCACVL1_21901 [Corchorus capsularis]|uniref:non-specific serine/threonine protein kinase n=1 Tax=Corchorus capsularis TaxID=210143 RepID=A0A1R3H1W2_COCAP|nr:hypothetical protein CCACVL1_21901 [Corchorus capsularis]